MLAEKQHSAAIMSQLAETKEEIEELQKKFTDANRTNDTLQDSLKRFSSHVALITQCNHTSTVIQASADVPVNNILYHSHSSKL